MPSGAWDRTSRVCGGVVGKESVRGSQTAPDHQLSDLNGSHAPLETPSEGELHSRHRVVRVHERMHQRVEEQKDEHRWGGVSVSSPHAEDCTCMVVALQIADWLSLEDENDGVDNLVVFGNVEEPDVDAETSERSVCDRNSAVSIGQASKTARSYTSKEVAKDAGGSVEEGPARVGGEEDVVTEHGLGEAVGLLYEVGRFGLAWTEAVVGGMGGKEVDHTSEEGDPGREGELKGPIRDRKAFRLGRVGLLRKPLEEGKTRIVEWVEHLVCYCGAEGGSVRRTDSV